MADNVILNAGVGGDTVAADDIAGVKYMRHKMSIGAPGAASDVSAVNPVPVTNPVSEASLASIDTKMPVAGQALMAASSPVVLASNHSPIVVTSSSRNIVGSFAVARPIVNGTVALQNLLSIEAVGATNVYIRRIYVAIGTDGAAVTGAPAYRIARTSVTPSAGTTLTVPKKRTSLAAATAVVRSAPTAVAVANDMFASVGYQSAGGAGTVHAPVFVELFVSRGELDDIVLVAGEGIVILCDTVGDVDVLHLAGIEWQEGTG